MTAHRHHELVQSWIDARRRYGLSHAHVQMARELGINPKKLGDLGGQGTLRVPLPALIERLYMNRFGRPRPERVVPIEQAPVVSERRARSSSRPSAPLPDEPAAYAVSVDRLRTTSSGPATDLGARAATASVSQGAASVSQGAASVSQVPPSVPGLTRQDIDAFRDIEFHRRGIALLSYAGAKTSGKSAAAFLIASDGVQAEAYSCSCEARSRARCAHVRSAREISGRVHERFGEGGLDASFRASRWFRLFAPLIEHSAVDAASVVLASPADSRVSALCAVTPAGELVTYWSTHADAGRFLERFRRSGDPEAPTRADVLQELIERTRNPAEREMVRHGARSRRQVGEESFWFRLAYHLFREFEDAAAEFRPAVNLETGAFTVDVRCLEPAREILHFTLPRQQVGTFLAAVAELFPEACRIPIHPKPAPTVLKADADSGTDGVEVEPAIRVTGPDGQDRIVSLRGLERYRYGDLAYLPEFRMLVRVAAPSGIPQKYCAPTRTKLAPSEIPSFLEELSRGPSGRDASGPPVVGLETVRRFDRVELFVHALDRQWCWLAVDYGTGNMQISLDALLAARERGQRFLPTEAGWIDAQSPEIAPLAAWAERLAPEERRALPERGMRVSKAELLRFHATSGANISIAPGKRGGDKETMDRLLDLRPARELEPLRGLRSSLREYQRLGVEWLLFLHDNGLGGLLCDDMGLGKTHQTLALFVALREQRAETRPFLVVCPATVLPHWERLARVHAPDLEVRRFYGDDRDLDMVGAPNGLVLTSYGVLRNDVELLSKVDFAVAVFDEMQTLKNPDTQAHLAAKRIVAGTRIGLTGTPVENRPSDLWALTDIVLAGYLGSLAAFEQRYGEGLEAPDEAPERASLSRVVSPFTLRRCKETVLTELPPKIEDLRLCRLSDDQVKLYRDAIRTRGSSLRTLLEDESRPIPYVHVFTLLDQLKRICAHPALVVGANDQNATLSSGKWDLFRELLEESLGSQQKVVIFSQFLDMIRLIARHLEGEGIGHVVLTGESRDRGEIVRRFNEDADCRVFVGSLKAGGVGIDLIAASVVIHYDRWWNAAKEDQATDRVHRMGQRRGVQVFKLVAEGTLEEKIAALIDKKRALAERLVSEDSPDILKAFGRKELLELLRLDEPERSLS